MKTVLLLRHGKSGWSDGSLEDHDRPLAARGVSAARAIGRLLLDRAWEPEVILCSSARRTQETLAELGNGFGPGLAVGNIESGLYLASADALIDRARSLPSAAASALIIGHNDGIHVCAQKLVGQGAVADIAKLANGFPTAGLAVIEFDVEHWSDLREGGGRLVGLVFPREID